MLQNDAEMYSLGLVGNARYCNGHTQVAVGMAPKKDYKIRKGKMIPNKDNIPSPTSPSADGKLKFSDRLKALLNSGGVKDGDTETDDPYTFSEPEPQVLQLYQKAEANNVYTKNCVSLKPNCTEVEVKPIEQNIVGEMIKIEGTDVARLSPAMSKSISQPTSGKTVLDNRVSDDESSKTMNRLQAKIAQNKVIGKHKKVHSSSPSPELKNVVRKRPSPPKNCWQPVKERSLLEEQLLGVNSDVVVKTEPPSPPLSSSPPKYQKPSASQKQYIPISVHSVRVAVPPAQHRIRKIRRKLDVSCHESLQRIQHLKEKIKEYNCDLFPLGVEATDSEGSEIEDEEDQAVFQRHWFSVSVEQAATGLGGRDGRLAQVRAETRRRLRQIVRGLPDTAMRVSMGLDVNGSWALAEAVLNAAKKFPTKTAQILSGKDGHHHNRSKLTMLVKRRCSYRKGESEACKSLALPCTQHCLRHIMYNVDQLLYEHCTAKFSDNTQCCVPVFDICHELPLCPEHARKRDNYDRMCAETRPKKIRKKAKPSAMTRPSKRGKKKRRLHRLTDSTSAEEISPQATVVSDTPDTNGGESSSAPESMEMCVKEEVVRNSIPPETHIAEENHEQSGIEVVEEVVFSMAEDFADPVELANQATRLLEEHDLTNVLNQIPADAFNDLFTDKNGQYEPTKEETEELERALEAVDKDVKSLERLSQTHGLMEPYIDDSALQTLVQLPEVTAGLSVPGIVPAVFTTYHSHNGFVVNSHHSTAAVPDIKNLGPHAVESPGLVSPCISIQTQTDTPS